MNPPLVVEFVHLVLRKVARLLPRLVLLAHDGAGQAHERLDAWEHLHHPRPALYLAVGALLDVVRAQALPVRGREVEVGQGVRLGLLQDGGRPRAARLQHIDRDVVHGGHGRGVAPAEDGAENSADPPPELPRPRLAHAVAHEVDAAPLPGGALEDLAERADEPGVGVGDDELDARDAAVPDPAEEGEPGVVRLGVDDVDAEDAAPPARVAADRRDDRRGGHAALPATLHVGRVQPDIGHGRAVERPAAELLDIHVEGCRDGADLVLRQPRYPHFLGYPLHLPGAGAGGVHLGDGRDERAVDPLVALDHVLREEAAGPELGDAERERAHAGRETALPVSVPAVRPAAAELVRLGVHHGVDHLLRQPSYQFLHVDGAVVKPRHAEHVGHRVC